MRPKVQKLHGGRTAGQFLSVQGCMGGADGKLCDWGARSRCRERTVYQEESRKLYDQL